MAPLLHVQPSVLLVFLVTFSVSSATTTTTTTLDIAALTAELNSLRAIVSKLDSSVQKLESNDKKQDEKVATVESGLEKQKASHEDSYDTGWVLFATTLVMLMQLGFALVEAGTVRQKSYRHVYLKNLLDFSVGISLWFIFGYWIAFPDKWDGMILDFAKYDMFYISAEARFFVFQTVFSSTAITIVSGAMAERTRMEAYLAFCGLCSGMLYSVVVRWTWGGGWLAEMDIPFHDFAGSGVVHATGGSAAFVGAWLVGPRIGRFDTTSSMRLADHYKPHSVDNILMGTFILWYGWFGFNPGSTTSLVEDSAATASFAFLNTMICPCWSAIVVMIIGITRHTFSKADPQPPPFDLGKICNGILGGLVGITAGCDAIPVKYTILLGIICGFGIEFWSALMQYLHIDDPVDAVAVHGFCGILGLLGVGLFHKDTGLVIDGNGDLMITQIKGAAAIVGYIGGTAFVYFYCVYAFGLLRTPMVIEIVGTDYHEYKDGDDFDSTELEIEEFRLNKNMLFARLEGTVWGISDETAMRYARSHRRVTVFWLLVGMVYNYFYYTHFEWRGWEFFSAVNMAVGMQCACACHAEFKCRPGELKLKIYCSTVIVIGMGLAICNFVIAPMTNLPMAWLRTMSLSFAWSWWFHLRVQPVDWESVCQAEQSMAISGEKKRFVYLQAMTETTKSSGIFSYILSLFFSGRVQHVGESISAYASVTSDMWVGLDEFRKVNDGEDGSVMLGVILILFSILQFSSVLGRLIIPHKHRSINFFRCILFMTAISELPIAIFVLISSNSSMKWVSVALSFGSVGLQLINLLVATYLKRRRGKINTDPPDEEQLPLTSLKQAEAPTPAPAKAAPAGEKTALLAEQPAGHLMVGVAHISNEGALPTGLANDFSSHLKKSGRTATTPPSSRQA